MNAGSIDELARAALDLSKNALLVNLRFMNSAFSFLHPLAIPHSTFATDGTYLRYDPATLARAYADEPERIARLLMHVTLHNVFLHPFSGSALEQQCWDVACDIVVEHAITELNLPSVRTARSEQQAATLARVSASVPRMTAETVYRWLVDAALSADELAEMRAPFFADDHDVWYRLTTAERAKTDGASGLREEGSGDRGAAAMSAAESGTIFDVPDDATPPAHTHTSRRAKIKDDIVQKEAPEIMSQAMERPFGNTINLDRSAFQWKEAAYELGVQLDSYAKQWGVSGSNLSMNLRHVTREKQDYREFLRKFARMGEHIRVNDDEFDYVYYCYGLSRYGNLPLIEPLEYTEEKRIRDFVIAIDTSASTKDGLVRKFVEKTYTILSQETGFFTDINVYIVQCDAAITHVAHLTNVDDLNDYLDGLQIHGLGGTDFRPVFEFVEAAVERGDLPNLGGLIYFTDGQGTFPARKPDFDAAFVFVEETSDDVAVPTWAMKVVLEETAIVED